MRADVEFLPLTGSPVRLDDLATAAARSAAALDATRADLLRLDDALGRQRSAAVDAARAVVEELRADVALSDDVLRTVSAALSGRAAALAQEQQDAASALARRDGALDRLARAEVDEAEAWQRLATEGFPAESARLLWDARALAETARIDIATAESDWRRARETKEGGSRWTAARIGTLEHVRAVRLAAAEGVGASAFATSWQVGRSIATSLQGTPLRFPSREPRHELLTAVRLLGDDPVAWRAFWEHVEADDVYRAFAGAPPGSEAAAALRTGVEAAAAGLTAAEQEELGRALVEGLGTPEDDGGTRAALLTGMLGGTLPAAVHAGAADALVERRSGLGLARDVDATTLAPVALVVAEGLAADPERALEHLAGDGPEVAADRARFWFGDRPAVGWSDGGVAVSTLLSAAVDVGTTPDASPTRRHEAAAAISAATPELVRPSGLLTPPGGPSSQVETNIVRAFEPYLPSFGDTISPADDRTGLALAPGYVEPDLVPSALCAVIGATSSTPHGARAWLGVTDDYVAQVEDDLAVAPEDSGPRMQTIVGAAKDAAVVAGAMESTALLEAQGKQRRVEAATVGGSAAISFATAGAPLVVSLSATTATTSAPLALEAFGVDFTGDAEASAALAQDAALERYLTPLVDVAREADIAAGYPADSESRLPIDGVDAVENVFQASADRTEVPRKPLQKDEAP